MPALPWTKFGAPNDEQSCLVMASHLPLAHRWAIPGFLAATMAIRRQLRTASGLLGYSLDADLVRGEFRTLSAWVDRESLDAFAQTDPHRSKVARIRPRMRPTKFVFWEARGDQLPISWSEARRRLEADPD